MKPRMLQKRLKVVLIDDDEVFSLTFKKYLSPQFEIHKASSGVTALELVGQVNPIDIIFLDKQLREESGLSLIQPLRKACPKAAIIILTGDSDFGAVQESLIAGADDYLIKSNDLIPDVMLRAPIARRNAQLRVTAEENEKSPSLTLPSDNSHLTQKSYETYLQQAEKNFIEAGLLLCGGRVEELAAKLGIGRSTLFKKLQDCSIERKKIEGKIYEHSI